MTIHFSLIPLMLFCASVVYAQNTSPFTPNSSLLIPPYHNRVNAQDTARQPKPNIIIAGDSIHTRTFQSFAVPVENGDAYADVVNQYQCIFNPSTPDTQHSTPNIRVYCMVIPTSAEFYCPDMAQSWTQSERISINHIYNLLNDSVTPVNAYSALAAHADEPIYARTDHHWMPLGAYYAAQEFARVAGVTFRDLNSYEPHVIQRFVGSMYRYSGNDPAVNSFPEDFIYYTPLNIRYSTSFVEYTLDKSRKKVISEKISTENRFFQPYPDGSNMAYCTFMGGDYRLTHVSTGTKNGRRLLILKDSFGNALPAYLFYGFQDIHIVDCRYFTKNLVNYVSDHQITDILFANNVSHACLPATTDSYKAYLVQGQTPPSP